MSEIVGGEEEGSEKDEFLAFWILMAYGLYCYGFLFWVRSEMRGYGRVGVGESMRIEYFENLNLSEV